MSANNELSRLRNPEQSAEKSEASPLEFLSEDEFIVFIEGLMASRIDESDFFLRQCSFSDEQIDEVKNVIESGNVKTLTKFFLEKIEKENISIKQFVESEYVSREINNAQESIRDFFNKVGIAIPDDFRFERAQFLGPYSSFLINVKGSSISIPRGRYYPNRDLPVIFLKPKTLDEIDDIKNGGAESDKKAERLSKRIVHTYVHENLHSISAKHIETSDGTDILSEYNIVRHKMGFSARIKPENELSILNDLNEGATEYFTQLILRGNGETGYKDEVLVVSDLLRFLSEKNVNEKDVEPDYNPDTEVLRKFLHYYVAQNGILSLGREMERKIGPHALGILETNFSFFRTFLQALQDYKVGGKKIRPVYLNDGDKFVRGERIRGRISRFRTEIEKEYPFVTYDSKDFVKKHRQFMENESAQSCMQENVI